LDLLLDHIVPGITSASHNAEWLSPQQLLSTKTLPAAMTAMAAGLRPACAGEVGRVVGEAGKGVERMGAWVAKEEVLVGRVVALDAEIWAVGGAERGAAVHCSWAAIICWAPDMYRE